MNPSSPSRYLYGLVMAGLTLLMSATVPAQAAPADVLQRPSLPTDRAITSLMLAVTRADNRLIAVGERGIILLSDDNGQRWRQAKAPVSTTLTSVQFPTAAQGWAVGHSGVVLHSDDGGETWAKQLDGKQVAELSLAAAKALKTSDEGAKAAALGEAQALIQDGPDKPFFDVHFHDAQRGLVVGAYGLAFATEDGGKTWASIASRIPNRKGKHLYRIVALGAQIWLVGEQGALFKAADVASPFVEQPVPYAGTLFGMVAYGDDEWVIYGLRGNAFHTADAGRSWTRVATAEAVTLTHGLRLNDGRIALANQSGHILVSSDRGQHFLIRDTTPLAPINALAEAADGSIAAATVRGMAHLPSLNTERAKP